MLYAKLGLNPPNIESMGRYKGKSPHTLHRNKIELGGGRGALTMDFYMGSNCVTPPYLPFSPKTTFCLLCLL